MFASQNQHPMANHKISREDLLQKSWEVFHRQGYSYTSMDDLATACGLKKGSFYYHFATKEVLLKEVVEFAHRYYRAHVLAVADDESLLPHERLEKLLRRQFRISGIENGGCFFGTLILETSNTNPELKPVFAEIMVELIAKMTLLFQSIFSPAYAREMAERTFLEYQGAAMMVKLTGDLGYKERFLVRIMTILNEKPARSPQNLKR